MKSVVFKMPAGLVLNGFLMGHHRFSTTVQLRRVVAAARGGYARPAGTTRLNLVVGGAGSEVNIDMSVGASGRGGELVQRSMDLDLLVGATAELRWQCVSVPPDARAWLTDWVVTVYYDEPGENLVPTPLFNVRWVGGARSGEMDLFRYNSTTMEFTEAVAGASLTRAVVTGGANFSVVFTQAPAALPVAMEAATNDLRFGRLMDNHSTATLELPRLEFYIGRLRVASLTRAGNLRVLSVREVDAHASLSGGTDRYGFNFGGALRGTLGLPRGAAPGLQSGLLREQL